MRKIIFQNMVSVDGYFEGSKREIDWHNVDAEFNEYAIDLLHHVDALIFGRVTYQLMAKYWPTPEARRDDPLVAELMNSLPKIVFSRTLSSVEWQNSRLVKENLEAEIKTLKQQTGKDLVIFGSSNLALTLIPLSLIDEFRLFIAPIVLGSGNPIFKGLKERLPLKLVKTKTFRSGNVLLYYQPVKK